ncbi:MAG: enzyme of heme biosynthesis [Alistipes sp.]|nr:enzyme of heme biosynthesis [Alistipes sp.]
MKRVKLFIGLAFALVVGSASAQDFSDPQYAKWGETPEQRKENILASTFLKEELANRNYAQATVYLQQLLQRCPGASENTYANGIRLYKQKINRARSLAEKNIFVDSLLLLYDIRLEYFGAHPKRGKAYILDRKAREHLTYRESDREGIRKDFEVAIAAQVESNGTADPELVAIYFKNLCDDYSNDLVDAMTIVNAYDANAKYFENLDESKAEFKNQFETCFGTSGAASCENLQKIFEPKIAANPNDEALLAHTYQLMSRANCESDFFLSVGEMYYAMKPQSSVAMKLAQVFQDKKDFAKANQYLREALAKETVAEEREKLLARIGILEMTANNYAEAIKAFNESINIDETDDDGLAIYFLAQCYVAGSKDCSSALAKHSVYWLAYDLVQKALPLLEVTDVAVAENAKKLANSYRAVFPTAEECFFAELKEGATYTIGCGLAKGLTTRVRYRAQ